MRDSIPYIHDSLHISTNQALLSVDSSNYSNFFGGNILAENISDGTTWNINASNPDWLSLVFILAAVYFIIIKFIFNINFTEGLKGLFKIEVLDDVGFEKTHRVFAFFFSPFSIIVYAYYLYFLINTHYLKLNLDYLFAVFAAFLLGTFLLKKIIELLIAFVFNTLSALKAYILDQLYLLGIGSIIQLILLLFFSYSQLNFILWISLGIMIIFFIYRLIRSFLIGYQLTSFSKSYLFLYLCSLEILPLIWIFKWLTDYH